MPVERLGMMTRPGALLVEVAVVRDRLAAREELMSPRLEMAAQGFPAISRETRCFMPVEVVVVHKTPLTAKPLEAAAMVVVVPAAFLAMQLLVPTGEAAVAAVLAPMELVAPAVMAL
jgi:hypothetical protein